MNRPIFKTRCVGPAAVLAIAVLAAGCTETMVAADDEGERQSDVLSIAAEPGDVAATVRGGAHYRLNDPPPFVGPFKWIYGFSFNVSRHLDGSADGTVRFRSRVPSGQNSVGVQLDWSAEVLVNCLEIAGNTAWISGVVVNANSDSPAGPTNGSTALFIVADNGNGAGGDEVNVGPAAAFGATDCRDMPPIFPGAFVDGNIHVTHH